LASCSVRKLFPRPTFHRLKIAYSSRASPRTTWLSASDVAAFGSS
jgi:hypothetical protein